MAITFKIKDHIAWITLDDGKANAVNPEFVGGLLGALDAVETDAKAIVLCGRPGIFCGGFDLNYLQSASLAEADKLVFEGAALSQRLFRYPLPVIALCTGHSLAMGALLLLACDTRIGVAGDFKIGLNETAISRPIPLCLMELARERLDPRRMTEAVIQAALFAPDSACDVGYLDFVVEQDILMDKATETAQYLAKLSGQAYAKNKWSLRRTAYEAYDRARSIETRNR